MRDGSNFLGRFHGHNKHEVWNAPKFILFLHSQVHTFWLPELDVLPDDGAGLDGSEAVLVEAEPVLGVVDGDEVGDELLVALPDAAALPLLGAEHRVVVQGVVHHGVACGEKVTQLVGKSFKFIFN